MGQINIGGANAAVQLQGNDTITTDQAFTFPDTGGELATNSSGGGQVVGYQQGVWTPVFWDDEKEVTLTTSYVDGYWTRIGNSVTVYVVFVLTSIGNAKNHRLQIKGVPYPMFSYSSGTSLDYAGTVPFFSDLNANVSSLGCVAKTSVQGIAFNMVNGTQGQTAVNFKYNDLGDTGSIRASLTYVTDDTTWQPQNGATIQ